MGTATWRAAVVVVLISLSTPPARGTEPRATAALVVQSAVNVGRAERQVLVAGLADVLEQELEVAVRSGREVDELLPVIEPSCIDQTSCIRQIIEALGVDDVLMLSILRVGDDVQVEIAWIDGRTGAVQLRPRIRLPVATGNFAAAFAAHAETLLPHRRRLAAAGVGESASRLPLWIAAGVSAAGLATGATVGIIALTRFRDCEERANGRRACSLDEIGGLESWQLGADIALGVGIAAGLTAAGLYLWGPPDQGAAVSAEVDSRGASVVIRGRF